MGAITYRNLLLSEAERIKEINASQFIGRAWRDINGIRQLIDINYHEIDFPDGYENHLSALKDTIEKGGSAIGAFDNNKLIGFCSINSETFGIKSKYVLLDQIFISLEYRKKGIGKQLFIRSITEAKKFGAEKLYICAGSSEETITFYKTIGCVEADEINTDLYEKDTRDIQLECAFV